MVLLLLLLSLSAPPQSRDPGERAFQRCGACHSLRADDSQSAGPVLRGVVGRRAGTAEGFGYTPAMREAGRRGLTWDEAALARFLEDPEAVVPGTAMPYQGGSAAERAAVIDFLKRQSP